jgi:hypothetical protein
LAVAVFILGTSCGKGLRIGISGIYFGIFARAQLFTRGFDSSIIYTMYSAPLPRFVREIAAFTSIFGWGNFSDGISASVQPHYYVAA